MLLDPNQIKKELNDFLSIIRDRGYTTRLEIYAHLSLIEDEAHFIVIKELLAQMGMYTFEQEPTEDELAILASRDDIDEEIEKDAAAIASVDSSNRTLLPIQFNIETGEHYSLDYENNRIISYGSSMFPRPTAYRPIQGRKNDNDLVDPTFSMGLNNSK